jgi:dihydroxyacetone kinase
VTTAEEYRKTALALMTNAKDAQSRLDSVIDVLIHELEAARADRDRLARKIAKVRNAADRALDHGYDVDPQDVLTVLTSAEGPDQ